MYIVVVFIALLVLAFVLYYKFRKTDVLRLGKPKEEGGEEIDVADVDGSALEAEGILVNIDDFLEQYIVGDAIPGEVLMQLQLKRLAGEVEARVSRQVMEEAKVNSARYWKEETEREACMVIEEKAAAKEEQGELDKAIALYERNVDSGYPAYRSFDRLISIYGEREDYDSQVKVLEKAVKAFGDQHPILREICQVKLEQAIKLRDKQKEI